MRYQTFAALGDPTRIAIVQQLSRGPASVTELAEPFAMSLRGVLKHVQVLEDAGLVRTVKHGRTRRCELHVDRLGEASKWIEGVTTQWERRMGRMETYLREKKGRRDG